MRLSSLGDIEQRMNVFWHILTFIACVILLPGGAAFSLAPRHSWPARSAASVGRRTMGVQDGGIEFARAAILPLIGSRRVHPRQESPRCAQDMKGDDAGDDTDGHSICGESAWKIIKDERTGAPSFCPPFSRFLSHAASPPASSPTFPSQPPPTVYSSPHDPLLKPTVADRPIRPPIDL
jgi:hypothetical protein